MLTFVIQDWEKRKGFNKSEINLDRVLKYFIDEHTEQIEKDDSIHLVGRFSRKPGESHKRIELVSYMLQMLGYFWYFTS